MNTEMMKSQGAEVANLSESGLTAVMEPVDATQEDEQIRQAGLSAHRMSRRKRLYLGLKRAFDFVLSLLALIVLAIPFAIIAIIQKINAPKEPVFFHQIRIGRNGMPFRLTKFRSMKSNAPHDCPTKDFYNGEQYITKFGRFLRNTSIDELPQLFQVLTGKMSLIGPRPLIPQEEEVHRLRQMTGVYQLRPGVTGWAQVNGRDLVSDENKVKLDCEYLEKLGMKIDLTVLFLTVKKVLKGTDIEEGCTPVQNQMLKK